MNTSKQWELFVENIKNTMAETEPSWKTWVISSFFFVLFTTIIVMTVFTSAYRVYKVQYIGRCVVSKDSDTTYKIKQCSGSTCKAINTNDNNDFINFNVNTNKFYFVKCKNQKE